MSQGWMWLASLRRTEVKQRNLNQATPFYAVIMMIVPGVDDMQLYQPTHKLADNLEDNR